MSELLTIERLVLEPSGTEYLELTIDCSQLSKREIEEIEIFIGACVRSKLEEFKARKPHEFVGIYIQGPCEYHGCSQLEDQPIHRLKGKT